MNQPSGGLNVWGSPASESILGTTHIQQGFSRAVSSLAISGIRAAMSNIQQRASEGYVVSPEDYELPENQKFSIRTKIELATEFSYPTEAEKYTVSLIVPSGKKTGIPANVPACVPVILLAIEAYLAAPSMPSEKTNISFTYADLYRMRYGGVTPNPFVNGEYPDEQERKAKTDRQNFRRQAIRPALRYLQDTLILLTGGKSSNKEKSIQIGSISTARDSIRIASNSDFTDLFCYQSLINREIYSLNNSAAEALFPILCRMWFVYLDEKEWATVSVPFVLTQLGLLDKDLNSTKSNKPVEEEGRDRKKVYFSRPLLEPLELLKRVGLLDFYFTAKGAKKEINPDSSFSSLIHCNLHIKINVGDPELRVWVMEQKTHRDSRKKSKGS